MSCLQEIVTRVFVPHFKQHGYSAINSLVALAIMNDMYSDFISQGVPKLEDLPETDKRRLWEISGRYFTDRAEREKACRCAYVLELLTAE